MEAFGGIFDTPFLVQRCSAFRSRRRFSRRCTNAIGGIFDTPFLVQRFHSGVILVSFGFRLGFRLGLRNRHYQHHRHASSLCKAKATRLQGAPYLAKRWPFLLQALQTDACFDGW